MKRIGIDHLGISSDFDGGGGFSDWHDASQSPNITIELVRRGYHSVPLKSCGAVISFG